MAASSSSKRTESTTLIIVCGVAGSGKTRIGSALAQELGWNFRDADDYHSPANIEKISRGQPLGDQEREPWLRKLANDIDRWLDDGVKTVLACSALKQSYRDLLAGGSQQVRFVYLKGPNDLFHSRLAQRHGHFFKANMLESQFRDLEEPQAAIVVNAQLDPHEIVAYIKEELAKET